MAQKEKSQGQASLIVVPERHVNRGLLHVSCDKAKEKVPEIDESMFDYGPSR